MGRTFLTQLNWRFATKKFDPNRCVKLNDLKKILAAVRLAPTSLGLQPFHVYVVRDQALRQKMRLHSNNQPQVTEASYLLVFCVAIDINKRIKDYLTLLPVSGYKPSQVVARGQRLRQFLSSKNADELFSWAARSTYIALGFALAAAAELNLDSCPMEGFTPDKIAEVLQLPTKHKPVVFLAVGYRAAGPSYRKIRFSAGQLFTFV